MKHPSDAALLAMSPEEREAYADALIFAQTRAQTVHAEKADILTPWKEEDRALHEVLLPVVTDERRGVYSRVRNLRQTWLNSRDGTVKARKVPAPQHARMVEHGDNPSRPGSRGCDGSAASHSSGPCSNLCYAYTKGSR